jgi:hypothetical protein
MALSRAVLHRLCFRRENPPLPSMEGEPFDRSVASSCGLRGAFG